MRLSAYGQKTIKRLTLEFFGESARIWLFGSRVNDHQKGGDIDLYLQSDQPFSQLFDKKIDFLIA